MFLEPKYSKRWWVLLGISLLLLGTSLFLFVATIALRASADPSVRLYGALLAAGVGVVCGCVGTSSIWKLVRPSSS